MEPPKATASPPIDIARLEKAAEVLKAVAHPVRLKIIVSLQSGERTVSDLYQTLGTAQAYMSQQLSLMKSKGVVRARRDGNQVYYALTNPKVLQIIHCVCLRDDNDAGDREF